MTGHERGRTLALVDLTRDRYIEDGHPMMSLVFGVAAALLLFVLLVPAVAIVGALLGFMAAAHIA